MRWLCLPGLLAGLPPCLPSCPPAPQGMALLLGCCAGTPPSQHAAHQGSKHLLLFGSPWPCSASPLPDVPTAGVIHFEGVSASLAALGAGSGSPGGGGGGGGAEVAAELAANELVFQAESNLCDITPLVTDAIVGSLPTVCLCGGSTCRQHAGREVAWSSSPQSGAPAAASPFAKLLAGKQPKKGRQRK